MVTGHGAGFVMCWQNDVQLSIAEDDDPRNFMRVDSGSYVLAIPDLGHYARQENDVMEPSPSLESSSSVSSVKQLAIFRKTIMKLNGSVRWNAGLVFERDLDGGGRSFNFIPHYDVVLKNPKYAHSSNGKVCSLLIGHDRLLTRIRSMMPSMGSAVTIFTCRWQCLHLMIANGPCQISSPPTPIIVCT